MRVRASCRHPPEDPPSLWLLKQCSSSVSRGLPSFGLVPCHVIRKIFEMCMDGQESGEEKEGRYMVINGAANVTEELAEINKASKQAHAVKAPAPIYLQTDHLSAHTTDHCPDPTLIPKASLAAGGSYLAPSQSTLLKPKATLPENPRGPPSWEPGRGGGRYADEVRTHIS